MSNSSNDMQNTVQTPIKGNPPTEISMGRHSGSSSGVHGSSSGVHGSSSGVHDKLSSSGVHTSLGSTMGGGPPKFQKPVRDAHGRYVFIVLLISALIATVAGFGDMPMLCTAARWVGCASLLYYAARKGSLATTILISMVIGTEIGYSFADFGSSLRIFSNIFLRLIKTIIAPLLFGTLVCGIAGHANIKEVGRMGIKSLIYFEIVTTLALFIGLGAINLTRAGDGIVQTSKTTADEVLGKKAVGLRLTSEGLHEAVKGLEMAAKHSSNPKDFQMVAGGLSKLAKEIDASNHHSVHAQSGADIILHAFPENIAKSVVENQVLQVVVFSVLFGIALAQLPEKKRRPVLDLCNGLTDVMFKFTNIIMLLAPLAVGSAIAYTVGNMGFAVLGNLAKLVGTLYLALAVFVLVVLVPVMVLCRIDIIKFMKAVSEPLTLAFATTSSEAALPKAMEKMEHFGVPRHIVAFVMPTGYSFNLDGSTLYLSLATVFVAQAANIPMPLSTQLMIVFTLMLTSKGVAGMPRATLVILLGAAASFGLPEWPILAILGVDELMDMARTSVNVLGNCLASVVIAKWENQLGPSIDEQSTISVAQLMWDSSTNSVKTIEKK